MPAYYVYLIYTAVLAVVLFAMVPRDAIKRLFVYALTFGGVADAALIFFIKKIIKVGEYLNYGPFGLLGILFSRPLPGQSGLSCSFTFCPMI